jgi:hypothetical protein
MASGSNLKQDVSDGIARIQKVFLPHRRPGSFVHKKNRFLTSLKSNRL